MVHHFTHGDSIHQWKVWTDYEGFPAAATAAVAAIAAADATIRSYWQQTVIINFHLVFLYYKQKNFVVPFYAHNLQLDDNKILIFLLPVQWDLFYITVKSINAAIKLAIAGSLV